MTVRRAQNSGIPGENLININTADEAQLTSVKGNAPSKANPFAKDAFEDGSSAALVNINTADEAQLTSVKGNTPSEATPKGALININTADEAQ